MKSKTKGSITFGTNILKTDEVVMFAKACMKEGITDMELINADLHFIDDCLQLMEMRMISRVVRLTSKGNFRKDSTMSAMIENRLDQEIKK